jgi:hypothetical protein
MIVQTETAVYVLDPPIGVLWRYPRENLVNHGWAVAALRKDNQAIPYELHPNYPLEVGKPAVFILQIRNDGVSTIRTTTPVTQIIEG